MNYQSQRLKEHEKAIKKRLRETPFREGVYVVKNPLLVAIRPKLILQFNKKRKKVKGYLRVFHKEWKLNMLTIKDRYLILQFRIDIIDMDFILQFTTRYTFEGYLDTPIGKLKVTGRYKKSLYGDRYE
jgi:hypothetical protein